MKKLKLKQDVIDHLLDSGSIVATEGKAFVYLPYWYEICKDGVFIEYTFDKLPENLVKFIRDSRIGINKK